MDQAELAIYWAGNRGSDFEKQGRAQVAEAEGQRARGPKGQAPRPAARVAGIPAGQRVNQRRVEREEKSSKAPNSSEKRKPPPEAGAESQPHN